MRCHYCMVDILRQESNSDYFIYDRASSSSPIIFSDLDDIQSFIKNAATFIEPFLFDFRTPMMKVELFC
jgi:hypothetical protein